MAGLVTLLTDFGQADTYVAEMKAVMLRTAPDLRLVDLTHDVPPGNVTAAQYLLARAWHRFPEGTVHLAVVDPGVGTGRRALAATHRGHRFVAPDNGLLTPVLDDADVVALPVPPDASPTFHGRDVFAPAAARLAAGEPLANIGVTVRDASRAPLPAPRRTGNAWVGVVVYVDHFGNLISNLSPGAWRGDVRVRVGGVEAGPLRRTFGDAEPGQPVAYVGSAGTVEIAVRDGSAQAWLGKGAGTTVEVLDA